MGDAVSYGRIRETFALDDCVLVLPYLEQVPTRNARRLAASFASDTGAAELGRKVPCFGSCKVAAHSKVKGWRGGAQSGYVATTIIV